MTHFIFTKDDVVTYNDRICYHYPFETSFAFSVPSKEFLSFVSSCGEKIEMEKYKGKVVVISGKAKAKFNTVVSNDIGEILEAIESTIFDENAKWLELPKDFLKGLVLCQFSIGGDELQNTLTTLLIEKNYVLSCDGKRASSYIMDGLLQERLMIKNKAVKEVIKFNPVAYVLKDNWLHFMNDEEAIMSVKNVEGTYPVEQTLTLIEKIKGKTVDLPKEELIKGINIVSPMTESEVKNERLINVTFTESQIILHASKAKGEAFYEIDFDSQIKEDVSIMINPDFLKDILEMASKMIIDYEGEKALFRTGKNFNHAIAFRKKN